MINRQKIPILLLILFTAISAFPTVSEYLNLSFGFDALWILLLPAIVYVRNPGEFSTRYLLAAIASLSGYRFIPSPIFLLFAAFFLVFYFIEVKIGKLNRLAPILVVLVTPLTKYFLDIFGFPVRLALSNVASVSLNAAGFQNEVLGNSIFIRGEEFTVDPACMGLKMVITSLLICLLLVSLFERRNKRELPLIVFLSACLISLALVVAGNLVRILLLILFHFPSETFGHEMIGILSLVLIVVFPQYLVISYFVKKFGVRWSIMQEGKAAVPSRYVVAASPLLILILAYFSWNHQPGQDIPRDSIAEAINIDGYGKEVLPNNVVRLTRRGSIIYIKPCKGIFRSDHHPSLCWRGSGFEFSNERIIEFSGTMIYTARLASDEEILHTAWWYDNGIEKTASQSGWRIKMLQGRAPFRLVNITCDSFESLMLEINAQWSRNLFSAKTTAKAY